MPGSAAAIPEESTVQAQGVDITKAGVPEALPLVVGGDEAAQVKSAVAFSEPAFETKDASAAGEIETFETLSPTQTTKAS